MKPGIINTAKMHNEQLKPLIAWLEANSINPYRLKRDQKIIFTGNRVTYSEVVETQHRRGGRRPVINRMTNEVKFQRRTKRIR